MCTWGIRTVCVCIHIYRYKDVWILDSEKFDSITICSILQPRSIFSTRRTELNHLPQPSYDLISLCGPTLLY